MQLAAVLGFELHHFCPSAFHVDDAAVRFSVQPDAAVDLLVTDGWPKDFDDPAWSLTPDHLAAVGNPLLLPTPPFSSGRELAFDPVPSAAFVGYEHKRALLPVQRAVIRHVLDRSEAQ